MTAPPRVVVVVAFGRADLIGRCLDALDSDEQVLIVDNSGDADIRGQAERRGCTYLDAGHNRGFAGGVNLALARLADTATPGDVLLLNPDAIIDSRGIDRLQDALRVDPSLGAVAPALRGPDGTMQRVTWPYLSPAGMWGEAVGLARLRRGPDEFVVGAVVLLRRTAIVDVGGFDERFFLYAEEADWQRRAAALGWRSRMIASVRAEHVGAATSTNVSERNARFHAAQETYVRRWFGARGWASYRVAAVAGAAVRALALPGRRRTTALERARLYLRGPARTAVLPPTGRPLRITHVVITPNLAGTERYVIDLARAQAARGHDVTVIGGDPGRMGLLLGADVRWRAGDRIATAWCAVRDAGQRDVVHTHLTSADLLGALSGGLHGARLVSTRHMAARRGRSWPVRLAAGVLQRRIDAEICVSDFVRAATGRPATVVRSGVADDDRRPDPASTRIIIAQRLEPEKQTEMALEAWRRSGLAADGWTLAIAGDGSLRGSAEAVPAVGVEWLGWVDDLRAVLLDSAALLASAPAEPFGRSVVEAMSVALPVIAAAGGGHLETVGRVEGSIVFAPGDVTGCARALRQFADLPASERRAYGLRLRNHQRGHLTTDRQVGATEAVYRDAGRATARPTAHADRRLTS